jgi:hypothetical protein
MTIGLSVGFTFFTGAPGSIKLPVAPASATAMVLGMSIPPACNAVPHPFVVVDVLSVIIVSSSSSSSSHSVPNMANELLFLFFVVGVGAIS